jgi:hypothetical protein
MIRDGPAAISNDLSIFELIRGDVLAKDRNTQFYILVFWERTASTKIRNGPACMFDESWIS